MMNKEKYQRTELEVIKFQTDDVITTSGFEDDELTEIIKQQYKECIPLALIPFPTNDGSEQCRRNEK